MKLVTGIEAIQSGKRFRKVYKEIGNCVSFGEWVTPNGLFTFTASSLLAKEWEIEQEPREFWINLNEIDRVYEVGTAFNPNGNPKYIKVREVI